VLKKPKKLFHHFFLAKHDVLFQSISRLHDYSHIRHYCTTAKKATARGRGRASNIQLCFEDFRLFFLSKLVQGKRSHVKQGEAET
jgi:hypothetical protein